MPLMKQPEWKLYERVVAAFLAENEGIEVSVTPNARIVGTISGTFRQVDALLDARWGDDLSKRIIVDAKRYRGKVDIKDVESFESMMRDCRAARGVIVCPNGWTEGARRRAQDAITIALLTLEEVENRDWRAAFEDCYGTCASSQACTRNGLVLWDAQHHLAIDDLWAIVYTGKCDACHDYHVWCWDCDEKFALGTEDDHTCACDRIWASLIEEEVDDQTGKTLNAVHLLMCAGTQLASLDRRMLR